MDDRRRPMDEVLCGGHLGVRAVLMARSCSRMSVTVRSRSRGAVTAAWMVAMVVTSAEEAGEEAVTSGHVGAATAGNPRGEPRCG